MLNRVNKNYKYKENTEMAISSHPIKTCSVTEKKKSKQCDIIMHYAFYKTSVGNFQSMMILFADDCTCKDCVFNNMHNCLVSCHH